MTMLCRSLSGIEFELHLAQAPHLYVVRKQWRETAQLAHPLTYYYILDGSIYQAPTVQGILASRLVRTCCLSAGMPGKLAFCAAQGRHSHPWHSMWGVKGSLLSAQLFMLMASKPEP